MYNNFPFPMPSANPPGNQSYGQQPYGNQRFSMSRTGVIRVHGRNGAEMFAMGPNDEALLLDDTQPVVWHKMTDGAGYATLTGYSISPLRTETEKADIRYADIDKRLSTLEGIINAKSNTTELPTVEYQTNDKDVKGRK